MEFETKRLILRPWNENDAEECYKYAKDPKVGPAAGWPAHKNIDETVYVIKNILMVPETYAIVLKETGLPVGSIGLHFHSDLAKSDDEAELGYWLGTPYWGQGLAPEASRELLRHAFMDLKLRNVWCGYYDGNEKSKRVQEKLGFVHQWVSEDVPVPQMGEVRKGHANLMTREQWICMRIKEMESILDTANARIAALEKASDELRDYQFEIQKLEAFYTGDEWKEAFALDEAGKLPPDIKRGVLSEDGIYDMLERNTAVRPKD